MADSYYCEHAVVDKKGDISKARCLGPGTSNRLQSAIVRIRLHAYDATLGALFLTAAED